MRNREGNTHFPLRCRDTNSVCLPTQGRGVDIVTNRTEEALWTLGRLELRNGSSLLECLCYLLRITCLVFCFPGKGTLECFCRFHTGLNEQVTHQPRKGSFCCIVGCVMQAYPVLFLMLPPIGADVIECRGKLLKCLLQGYGLFKSWMKLYSDGSVHTHTLPYMSRFCQMMSINEKGEGAIPPTA